MMMHFYMLVDQKDLGQMTHLILGLGKIALKRLPSQLGSSHLDIDLMHALDLHQIIQQH
jgi:hypothetical protein